MSSVVGEPACGSQAIASAGGRRRFAVVISHPIQHFVPLFSRLTRSGDVELKVFYCCDWGVREYTDPGFGNSFSWDIPLLEGYAHEFLAIRRRPESLGFFDIDNPQIGARLTEFAPDAVWVHGYSHRTSWRVVRWARRHGAHVLYFGDSELLSSRSRIARCGKRVVLPWFFRRCDGFLTIGDNNEAYYRHYGVRDEQMFRGCFPIDLSRFRSATAALTDADRRRLRIERGLDPDAMVVLFVGKLISIKRPLDLVEAVSRIQESATNVQALVIGSGPLESEIRRRIGELRLETRVKLSGFVNQSEMPRMLWLGDIIAMTSEKDPHPLAVSEAMAVGNAVVASDRVGCVGPTDAARPGENTVVYPSGDVASLAARLAELAGNGARLRAMRQASLDLSPTQDVEQAAQAVLRFLRSAV